MSLIEVKKAFFDQKKILNESDRLLYRGLSKLGAFTRRTAQFSMKSKKGASPSGIPPYSHGDKKLKKFLFFSYDSKNKELVVGPVRLARTSGLHVPKTEEFGGVVSIATRVRHIIKKYPARPYIKPAGEENLKKLPQLFSMNRATRK